MPRHQRLELRHGSHMASELDLSCEPLLECGEPHLLEASDLHLGEPLVGEIGQRRPAPERECLVQLPGGLGRGALGQGPRALGGQRLEALEVELPGPHAQLVALSSRHQYAVSAERPAQARDVDLDALGGRGVWASAPQIVDQAIARHGLVGVQKQNREQRSFLAAWDVEPGVPLGHVQRAENAKVHQLTTRSRRI